MSSIEEAFIDYLYRNLDTREVEELMSIRPGEIVLRNSPQRNLFEHPHVELWHRFLLSNIPLNPAPYALILPCTRRKPYRISATHRLAEERIRRLGLENLVDVYIMSEPMVLVPRCLDIYYPFANYEYPPQELDSTHRSKFVDILSRVVKNLVSAYRLIVAVLPRHHASIFVEAVSRAVVKQSRITVVSYAPLPFRSIARAISILAEAAEAGDPPSRTPVRGSQTGLTQRFCTG